MPRECTDTGRRIEMEFVRPDQDTIIVRIVVSSPVESLNYLEGLKKTYPVLEIMILSGGRPVVDYKSI